MVFSAILNDVFRNNSAGICFRYRADGGLFNLSRLKVNTKTKTDIVRDLLFTDDCALNATSLKDMQDSMDLFSLAYDAFGLTISTAKTLVMYQPAPGVPYTVPVITVKGQKLNTANKFVYLGSTLSQTATIDEDVALRIARTSAAFGSLRANV